MVGPRLQSARGNHHGSGGEVGRTIQGPLPRRGIVIDDIDDIYVAVENFDGTEFPIPS